MNKAASVIACALCACSLEVKDPANDPDPRVQREALRSIERGRN